MAYNDPRDLPREIEDDPHQAYDAEKEPETEVEPDDSDYRYTDWASI